MWRAKIVAAKDTKGLDPQVAGLLKQMIDMKLPELHTMAPRSAREFFNTSIKLVMGMPEEVSKVEDMKIPGPAVPIPIRVYTPGGKGPFPIFVYIHGGGFVVGDIHMGDNFCRAIANRASCVVVSVDYRLAPEHKFPAALDDSYAAVRWVADNADHLNGDRSRIAVGGDSAGGNLSAVVSLRARDESAKFPVCQVLIYPATNLSMHATGSMSEFSEGYFLTGADMLWFGDQYFEKGHDRRNPYASPLLAADLSNLPSALIITAGFDPLRDEGEAYGNRLRKAGVPVKVSRYAGMIHGFITMDGMIDKCKDAINEVAANLREAFHGKNKPSKLTHAPAKATSKRKG
jgi:acetyl esterase